MCEVEPPVEPRLNGVQLNSRGECLVTTTTTFFNRMAAKIDVALSKYG